MKQSIKEAIKKHNEKHNENLVVKKIYESKNYFFLDKKIYGVSGNEIIGDLIETDLIEHIDELTEDIKLIPCSRIYDFLGNDGEVFLAENGMIIYLENGRVKYANNFQDLIENVFDYPDTEDYDELKEYYDAAMKKLSEIKTHRSNNMIDTIIRADEIESDKILDAICEIEENDDLCDRIYYIVRNFERGYFGDMIEAVAGYIVDNDSDWVHSEQFPEDFE